MWLIVALFPGRGGNGAEEAYGIGEKKDLVTHMVRNRMKRWAVTVLAVLAAAYCAAPAMAAVPEGAALDLAMRIQCLPDGDAAEGMQYQLYYLASVSEDGTYTVVEPYASAGLTAEMVSNLSYRTEAMTLLAEYINGTGQEADYAATTGSNGTVIVRNLADGVYLCASNTRYVLPDGTAYTPVPFIFRLNRELVDSRVTVSEAMAPEDGVTTSAENPVTAVTKFNVTRRDDRDDPTDTPVTPDSPDTPATPENPDTPATPDNPDTPVTPDNPATPEDLVNIDDEAVPLTDPIVEILDDPVPLATMLPEFDENEPPADLLDIEDEEVPLARLPQTGLLWWPVPVMAVSGVVLFLVGWKKSREAA